MPLVDGTLPRSARIELNRHPQRPCECLEYRFALMMRVVAAQVVDVQRGQRVIGEALKKFMREIDVEAADHRARKWHMPFETWPA